VLDHAAVVAAAFILMDHRWQQTLNLEEQDWMQPQANKLVFRVYLLVLELLDDLQEIAVVAILKQIERLMLHAVVVVVVSICHLHETCRLSLHIS
jgi:hypothetical protein